MNTKRNIFEEVETRTVIAPQAQKSRSMKPVTIWLLSLVVLIAVMIVVGGLTRLTDSGLSITEWKPVTGSIPPLSMSDWQSEFEKYQKIPEFELQNGAMTLEQFKTIFWWEWAHRFLGRLIGGVYLVGAIIFSLTGHIKRGRGLGLAWLGAALVGVQGVIGWWMVSSGLTGTMTDVASTRLAVHLGLAFIIIGLTFWNHRLLSRDSVDLVQARRARVPARVALARILLVMVFVQIIFGALVAGIDAGRSYTDWPKMGGEWWPSDIFVYPSFVQNLTESAALVQLVHRLWAYALVGFVIYFVIKARRSSARHWRAVAMMVGAMTFLQVVIGIITLLRGVPVWMGAAHQAGAVMLFIVTVLALFLAHYPRNESVRDAR